MFRTVFDADAEFDGVLEKFGRWRVMTGEHKGAQYYGEVDSVGQPHGKGTMIGDAGGWQGGWRHGWKHGRVLSALPNGTRVLFVHYQGASVSSAPFDEENPSHASFEKTVANAVVCVLRVSHLIYFCAFADHGEGVCRGSQNGLKGRLKTETGGIFI